MKTTPLFIQVSQPCAQQWSAMTPSHNGRHCAACQKTVTDFTLMSDAEVVAHLSRPSSSGCGRFRAEQLNRPLRAQATSLAWRRWMAAMLGLAGLGIAAPAVAQTKTPASQEQKILPGKTTVPAAALPERIIRGRVTVVGTNEWLPGVTVLVKGTTIGTSTDADGNFELKVPFEPDTHLTFSSIGYFPQQIALADFKNQSISIQLATDEKALSEQIVTGGYCGPPWHTPRGLWQRLTRPFRR